MKRLSLVVCLLAIGSLAGADPIDRLAEDLGKHALWQNGIYPSPKIDLPLTATGKEIAAAYFDKTSESKGKITDWEIYDERIIDIPNGSQSHFTAIWCGTEFGGRIILAQYGSAKTGWWTRAFNAKYYGTSETNAQ
jgi:hypothetical protein